MISRREFIGAATVVAGGVIWGGILQGAEGGDVVATTSRAKLVPLGYDQVKITGGPLKAQQERIFALYRSLDTDRLLKVYRQWVGMPAPGNDMGGWYDQNGFAPGHALGQITSGLSRFVKNTGDAAGKEKVRQIVKAFAETLSAEKSFLQGNRFPAYIFDKMVIGLVDAHRFAGNPEALDVLAKWVEKSKKHLPEKALTRKEMAERPHKDVTFTWDESYTLPEYLFIAAEVTGEKAYAEMAKRYLHDKPYFDPLSRGENVLPGNHAYSHFNCLSSGAKAYLATGDEKYLRAVTFAWNTINTTQRYASGGWGPNEAFVEPGKGTLGEMLEKTHNHFETPCGALAEFKLGRYLLSATGEANYADPMERMLYNGILAIKDPKEDGSAFYYSDYHEGARKNYHPEKWPCCAGSLPQVVADYTVSLYMRDDRGIAVCLFAPSEVKWEQGGVPVEMVCETAYPKEGEVRLTVKPARETKFVVRLREPGWAEGKGAVEVNGLTVPAKKRAGFVEVEREWKAGDRVRWTLPMEWRQEKVDEQHENMVALVRGPVLMVGVSEGVKAPQGVGDELLKEAKGLGMVRFKPFYEVGEETYVTYMRKA
ncbi:MAG TPA: beta-L-arabinofuranosidase domain-containing protein [Tepidisphaeraceae bacterium]|jgi:hypothetical protein